ncbi:GntR family transcriptional regulator [Rhizobium sp. CC-YZS058]|uniref:GntR family transcriptional regulator n=1 Tax=Rhizobium sp. CC-YZS058 TaxID=3042153 RepID=UPI002B05D939|nr:GntR family transcriptional regulator [Rhizobium sp. CC-YZS058]
MINHLASKIVEYVRAQDEPNGMRLVERKLAEHLKVSRSPVRSALKMLEEQGLLKTAETGGFYVDWDGRTVPASLTDPQSDDDDEAYMKIAGDRLSGDLPDKVTESELARRYGLTKAHLGRVLRRIAGEGWIDRLPGHGWEFLPMLTSMQAYKDSYRFRLTIEPAAILEPTFVLNRSSLEDCRQHQQRLIDGEIWDVSNPDLFDINSRLHEAIIECSHNLFFIESLKRIDRLRRLIEYRQSLNRKYAIVRCREHVRLVDLLLQGRMVEASEFMTNHLSSVSVMKTVAD